MVEQLWVVSRVAAIGICLLIGAGCESGQGGDVRPEDTQDTQDLSDTTPEEVAPEELFAIIVSDQTVASRPPKVMLEVEADKIPAYVVLRDGSGTVLGDERVWFRGRRGYLVTVALAPSWTPVPVTASLYEADGNSPDLQRPISNLAGSPVVSTFEVIIPPKNSLDVRDQTLSSWGYKISVANLATEELPAWVVVYEDNDGAPGRVLGKTAVTTSPKVSLSVDLVRFVAATETLWVGLARDLAPVGSFGAEDPQMLGDGATPLMKAIQVTNQACGGPKTKFCDPLKPHVIRWRDHCDAVTHVETSCGDGLCDDTGLFVACRPVVDACAGVGGTICVDEDPTATWFEDRCGVPLRVAARCGATSRCEENASGASCKLVAACAADPSDPDCIYAAPCEGPAQKFCDPDDISKIKWLGPCGNELDSTIPCGAGFACSEADGEARCVSTDVCGGNTSTVCVNEDPAHVYWVDACGALTGSTYPCGVATCTAVGDAATCVALGSCEDTKLRVCDPEDPSKVFLTNACGDELGVFSSCANGKRCVEGEPGQARCECVPTEEVRCFGKKLYEPSGGRKVDSCGNWSGETAFTCELGQVCEMTASGPACGTSLTDRDSPMYHRGCSFPDYLRYKTDLAVDCRCRRHAPTLNDVEVYDMGGNMACANQSDSWARGWTMGEGPNFFHMGHSFSGGGAYSAAHGELFATKHFTDPSYEGAGLVVAYDIKTGRRRVVSGRFPLAGGGYQMFGSGFESVRAVGVLRHEATTLPGAWDLELGGDGQLYVWGSRVGNKEITRVDPDTGARTLIWSQALESENPSAPGFGQCWSTRPKSTFFGGFIPVELEDHAFARGPDGSFYLGFRNESAEGNGIVRISANGSSCTVVSRWNGTMGAVGGGASPQYSPVEGFLVRAGKLYASLQIGRRLLVVDLATGDRSLIANPAGSVESTPGQSTMFWDERRDLLITAGGIQSYLAVAIDPTSGLRQALFLSAPGMPIESAPPWEAGARGAIDNGNYMGYGALAFDPDDDDHFYMVIKWGLIKYEMSTGNSFVMSQ